MVNWLTENKMVNKIKKLVTTHFLHLISLSHLLPI